MAEKTAPVDEEAQVIIIKLFKISSNLTLCMKLRADHNRCLRIFREAREDYDKTYINLLLQVDEVREAGEARVARRCRDSMLSWEKTSYRQSMSNAVSILTLRKLTGLQVRRCISFIQCSLTSVLMYIITYKSADKSLSRFT